MEIFRAEYMGMCSGVRRALDLIDMTVYPENWTILGDLVHNDRVMTDLRLKGYRIVSGDTAPEDVPAGGVVVTAHGCSERRKKELSKSGRTVLDTTCPKVRRLHELAVKSEKEGFFPVIIGNAEHPEIKGIIDDLDSFLVCSSLEEVQPVNEKKIAVLSQTTFNRLDFLAMAEAIKTANPNGLVRFFDTVCNATEKRQDAVRRLCVKCDCVVVVGGKNSNNTINLARICEREGVRTFHIQGPENLCFRRFSGEMRIGLTAGASTPDGLVEAVLADIVRFDTELRSAEGKLQYV